MKRVTSQPTISFEESDDKGEFTSSSRKKEFCSKGKGLIYRYKDSRNNTHDIAEQVERLTIQKLEPCKRCEELYCERHGLFRTPQQKANVSRFEKQLRASWDLEDLIEGQLDSFRCHYDKSTTPTRLKDVAQLLMPRGTPASELAASTWHGGWRPSAILDLLRSLSSSLSDSTGVENVLPQLLKEMRIEETIIDEEMAEIQAKCILHLPFGPMAKKAQDNPKPALESLQSEFQKIHRVIIRAQDLRLKALEMVVKNVLKEADAAEFLVAFARIRDLIHQVSTQTRLQKS